VETHVSEKIWSNGKKSIKNGKKCLMNGNEITLVHDIGNARNRVQISTFLDYL